VQVTRAVLVQTLGQALQVRNLRNTCCEYMTNYQQEIGLFQQIRWFFVSYLPDLRAGKYRIYLFLSGAQVIGYGAVDLKGKDLYITECVHPNFRGQGYGHQILSALMQLAASEGRALVAEIWSSNVPSIRLHQKNNFRWVQTRLHKGLNLEEYRWEPEKIWTF
jgi:RimJ/RimL family protein N-acetyltransferase